MTEIIALDAETTGLPDWKVPSDSEHQPHIVQLAAQVFDEDSGEVKQSIDLIIKPDGWEIPQDTTDIHGITTEYALDVGVPEKDAVGILLAMWSGKKRIAHNHTFDARIIRIALKRYFSEEAAESWKAAPYECTGILAKPIMKMLPKGRYGYKMPKLVEAYEHFTGKILEDAHSAMADTNACREVYLAIKKME